jgi:hypothetical protein
LGPALGRTEGPTLRQGSTDGAWVEQLGRAPTLAATSPLARARESVAAHDHPVGRWDDRAAKLAACEPCVRAVARWLDVPYRALVWDEKRRSWRYRSDDGHLYALADVRVARVTGDLLALSANSRSRWTLRLAFEIGAVEPAVVRFRTLPPSASPSVRRLYDAFLLHYALRSLREPGEPVVFARSFARLYARLTEREARSGFYWLKDRGFLRHCGTLAAGGKVFDLWLPGEGALHPGDVGFLDLVRHAYREGHLTQYRERVAPHGLIRRGQEAADLRLGGSTAEREAAILAEIDEFVAEGVLVPIEEWDS